jgi:uncharacterized MAPEG superfamily protein
MIGLTGQANWPGKGEGTMGSELGVLGLYGLFVVVTIVIQVLAAMMQVGLPTLLTARDDMADLTGVAGRLDRAQANSIVAMALFAPAVLILGHKGLTTSTTLLAAQAFLVARVLYVPVYALGLPGARTLIWAVGFVATAWLYIAGMGAAAAM